MKTIDLSALHPTIAAAIKPHLQERLFGLSSGEQAAYEICEMTRAATVEAILDEIAAAVEEAFARESWGAGQLLQAIGVRIEAKFGRSS